MRTRYRKTGVKMSIDVHSHYFPEEYLNLLEKYGSLTPPIARNMRAGDQEKEIEGRIALMDQAGVGIQILSATPQVPYFLNKNHAVTAAKMVNNRYRELVQRYPNRFKAFGILPLPHVQESILEMNRCLDELDMVGIAITTTVLEKSLIKSDLEELFAALDHRKAVLFLHPAGCCTGDQTKILGLTWMIGAPFEDTYGLLHLILSGYTLRYPNIRIISTHLGGMMSLILQRLDNLYSLVGTGEIAEKPSTLAKKIWYDTVAHYHSPALRCACECFGYDRLLLGTDFPYAAQNHYIKAIQYIQEAGLPKEAVDKILKKNAHSLFGI